MYPVNPKCEIAAVSRILARIEHPVIVELGACDGDDSEWMREACKHEHERYIMVEPDPELCRVIREERLGHATLFEAAIVGDANAPEYVDFYVTENDKQQLRASGSTHQPTGHLKEFPWCKFPKKIKVKGYTLDLLFEVCGLTRIDLLWVDIQGAERDMIAGGQEALAATRYLFIEAEEQELYEGQALRPELLSLLPDFRVIREFNWNLLLEHR